MRTPSTASLETLRTIAEGVPLPPASGVPISKLYTDEKFFSRRDPDFDSLSDFYDPRDLASTSCFEPPRPYSFAQMCQSRLGINIPPTGLEETLIDRGLCYSIQQTQDVLVMAVIGGNPLRFKMDGKALIFLPFQTGERTLAVLQGQFLMMRWQVFFRQFSDVHKFSAPHCIGLLDV
jgi:hypothetical protein